MNFDPTYTDHKQIMTRIARRHKSLVLSEIDIIEWCQEVEIDTLGSVDQMYTYIEFPLTVKNGRCRIPCNTYRILDVYLVKGDRSSRIPFGKLKGYISVDSTKGYTQVYMDFTGLPVDMETGIPMIIAGHEAACEAYCVYSSYLDSIETGKVGTYQAEGIISRMQAEILAAAGSHNIRHKTREDLNKSTAIHYNLIPQPAGMNLINGTF